ncbi:MAG: hypothetical protein JWP72_568 [Massilia sp.]|nr:hypothetical protein [Massilia sp.]
MYKSLIALLFVSLLAACTKEPPKCSDPATLTLVKQIILDKIGVDAAAREKIGLALLDETLTLENMRPSASDEKIKKVSCEATLVVKTGSPEGDVYKLPIDFDSQLDDKNDHIVAVRGLLVGDLRQIDLYTAAAIENAREKAAGNETAATPAAGATVTPETSANESQPQSENAQASEAEAEVPDTVEKSGVCKGLDLAITVYQSECLSRKYTIADKKLNDEYKRVMDSLSTDRRTELLGSQRAWIKEKDQRCEEAGKEAEGGTLQPILIADCTVRMTEERTAFLANYD